MEAIKAQRNQKKGFTILGQDMDVILAVFGNIVSWMVRQFVPSLLPRLLPAIDEEDTSDTPSRDQTKCIAIGRPGGSEQLRVITLKPGYATAGYNIGSPTLFVDVSSSLPKDTVVVKVAAFSVNFADCCIRWGLYESANKFVGWPIVPGFDIAGTIEQVSEDYSGDFKVGDKVYGATFFGSYSTRVLVPTKQLRKLPSNLTMAQAAAVPAVSLTALYSLHLGGQFPPGVAMTPKNNNNNNNGVDHKRKQSILIHSAAGGVGSMLVQMSKLLGMSQVVGVVGSTSKVQTARELNCDVIIDKSKQNLWEAAKEASPDGYHVIADANGVSTLQASFDHLAATGRLIVFGFHSNLPMGSDMLHPWAWWNMIVKMIYMPKFDTMDLVTRNRSILGFNLSFFVDEIGLLVQFYEQISDWLQKGLLKVPHVVEMNMKDISKAHELIQSGKSVGKIVMMTEEDDGGKTATTTSETYGSKKAQ
ncbi:unnamed protein product [Cylindrotheca closterium]|uniref:Enoyl reductase (ER) domain-containing protein n=1 Tax=Cylindrotheca closterium TaxID=2856 RepID=A0AAD2FX43_9STRA|nr:unnamed protein product [Cylindrotheca closterium]